MKYAIAFLAVFICLSVESSAQSYGLDNTNPAVFSNFKIPKTDLSALWFNTGLNYSSNMYSVFGSGGANSSRFNSNFNVNLSPQYYALEESDNRYLSLSVNAAGSTQSQFQKNEGAYFGVGSNVSQATDVVSIGINGVYRNYAPSGNMFYSVSSSDQFSMTANYSSSSPGLPSQGYYDIKNQSYSFSFGVGVGKMRNVTSVVSAVRFQQRLKRLNLLNGDLNEKTIEDLAQQFYREGYYGDVHVRPDKFFWQDVQTTLSNDGVSLAGLNQYADSYLREVPNELRFMRNEGMVAGLNVQVEYNNAYMSLLANSYRTTEELYTLANAYIQYSHQLNLNSQLAFGINLSGGPNIVRDSPVTQQYTAGANVGYDYELTDRIVASVSNSFNVIFQNMGPQSRDLTNTFRASVNYFVEDNISAAASYSWNYNDVRNPAVAPEHTNGIDNYLSVGLTYYIDRGFMYK